MTKQERYNWSDLGELWPIRKVPLHRMQVDMTYQRNALSQSKVLAFARNWDYGAAGVITASLRPDGYYYVIDGNHRREAALARGDIDGLHCKVITGLTLQEEASLFVALNMHRTNVNSYTKYRAALASCDKLVMGCDAMLTGEGLTVAQSGATNVLAFPDALLRAWKVDTDLTKTALIMCRSMVGPSDQIGKEMFMGAFYLLRRCRDVSRVLSLAGRIYERGGRKLVQNAIREATITLGQQRGHDRVACVAILGLLNRQLRNPITLSE